MDSEGRQALSTGPSSIKALLPVARVVVKSVCDPSGKGASLSPTNLLMRRHSDTPQKCKSDFVVKPQMGCCSGT